MFYRSFLLFLNLKIFLDSEIDTFFLNPFYEFLKLLSQSHRFIYFFSS